MQTYKKAIKPFCAEAAYAHTIDKKIIPLRLEAGYKPDGWLGPLCLNDRYYDLADQKKYEDEWKELEKKLREIITAKGSDTGMTIISSYLLENRFYIEIIDKTAFEIIPIGLSFVHCNIL